jgi:hypothetical protein
MMSVPERSWTGLEPEHMRQYSIPRKHSNLIGVFLVLEHETIAYDLRSMAVATNPPEDISN